MNIGLCMCWNLSNHAGKIINILLLTVQRGGGTVATLHSCTCNRTYGGNMSTASDSYTGNMISGLLEIAAKQQQVDEMDRQYAQLLFADVARQTRVCRICRWTYADHSHENGFCPTGLARGPFFNPNRRFTEITCQASVGDSAYQCDRECLPGSEYCAKHYEE